LKADKAEVRRQGDGSFACPQGEPQQAKEPSPCLSSKLEREMA